MASNVKAIPEGYHSVTPYLSIKGAAAAIEFYKKAFGATVEVVMGMPDGRVGHAELKLGDSRIMLADEMPDMPDAVAQSPATLGGTTFGLNVYLPDVDTQFQRAVAAGATVKRPVKTQFYGDRSGTLIDPFGHAWTLSTHVEDVSPEEMKRRMAQLPTG
ncbi:MAG TPA: VOC family protein [Polyangia bacterium]|nr:VOC family protein [Polyangia bacterium]